MSRLAAPPAVDLAQLAKGGVFHHVAEVVTKHDPDGLLGVVRTVCGTTKIAEKIEAGVDARAESINGTTVCAHCRAGGSTLNPKTTDHTDHTDQEDDMKTDETTTQKPKRDARRAARPKPSAPKKTAAKKSAASPISAADLKAAVARAEKAIATQPKRTTAELSAAQSEKAFKLGKAIAADRWLLKKAVAGKTEAATVAGMVERIEARIAERNTLRNGS